MSFPANPFLSFGLILGLLLSAAAGGYQLAQHTTDDTFVALSPHPLVAIAQGEPRPSSPAIAADFTLPQEEIYRSVEQMPLFKTADCAATSEPKAQKTCAERALLTYAYARLKYPATARQSQTEGMAVVSFVVEKDGSLSSPRVERDPGAGTGDAAADIVVQMIKDGVHFEPGRHDGKPVRTRLMLPIRFTLRR